MKTKISAQDTKAGGLDRRAFLKAGGATAMAALLAPGLAGRAEAAGFTGSLDMLAWDFQPDMIKTLVGEWTAKGNPAVNLAVIPNVGYSPALQTRLRGGDAIDLYYNFAYNSQKFVDQDWASKLNGLPGVDDMVADMFESARPAYVNASGDIISAPYFSAVHMMHYNQRMLKDAGIAAAPQTLKEIYDASKILKDKKIVDSPYVAYWVKEFCEEYLHTYLLNEGVTAFDTAGKPVFADDPKTVGVFEWWQAMYQEGLASKSVLNTDPGKLANQMAQGEAAFFVLHHYFLTSIRTLAGPESANVMQSPIGGSNFTFQIGEVLQLGAGEDAARREAAWDLMKFYGWKDSAGKFTVFNQWAKAAGLAAPYPGFFKDPDVIAAFPDYYDLPLISKTFETGSKVVPARTLPWYPDFQAKVGDVVHALLLGQATPAQTVENLTAAATSAQKGRSL